MINIPDSIPPDTGTDAAYLASMAAFATMGFLGKHRVQESLKTKIPDRAERAVSSYALITITGAVIGGALKVARTGTINGTIAGAVVGAISTLCGGILADIYDSYEKAAVPSPKLG